MTDAPGCGPGPAHAWQSTIAVQRQVVLAACTDPAPAFLPGALAIAEATDWVGQCIDPLLRAFSSGLCSGGITQGVSASLCCCQGLSHLTLCHLSTSTSYNGTLKCCNFCRCAQHDMSADQAEHASPVMMMPPSLCPSLVWFCRPPAGPATLSHTHMLHFLSLVSCLCLLCSALDCT